MSSEQTNFNFERDSSIFVDNKNAGVVVADESGTEIEQPEKKVRKALFVSQLETLMKIYRDDELLYEGFIKIVKDIDTYTNELTAAQKEDLFTVKNAAVKEAMEEVKKSKLDLEIVSFAIQSSTDIELNRRSKIAATRKLRASLIKANLLSEYFLLDDQNIAVVKQANEIIEN